MMKTLSVVVRSSNDAPSLNRCLTALSRQTYPGELVEVIVADSSGSLQCQQLVRWWSSQNLQRTQPELRYLKVSRNRPTALLDAARYACGAVVVFVDDDFEVLPEWSLEGVAAAMREKGSDRGEEDLALALERGEFVLRHDFLLREGHGGSSRVTALALLDASSHALASRARSADPHVTHLRVYAGLLLLLATLTLAVMEELPLALLGVAAWSSITCWLAVRLLHANIARAGGWRALLRFRRASGQISGAVITTSFSSKESRHGTQGI